MSFAACPVSGSSTGTREENQNPTVCEISHRHSRAFREEGPIERFVVVCQGKRPWEVDGIEILPWEILIQRLTDGELVGDASSVAGGGQLLNFL